MSSKSGLKVDSGSAASDPTTDAILDTALSIFGVAGFKATTLSEVATRAGVSRPTLYARYPDKTHLFRAVIERGYDEAMRAAERTLEEGGDFSDVLGQVLLDYYGALFDRFHDLPKIDELSLFQSEHAHDLVAAASKRIQRLFARMLREYLENGRISLSDIGLSVPQLVDLIRLAPLSLKPPGTTRAAYRTRLKNFAIVISSALGPDTPSIRR